ncbi:MAG: DUF983 domain-containing protein [Bacteroidota bacterium]
MFKGSKLYSIFSNKCPKCHQGDVFVNKNPYSKGFINMHTKCSHCGELFEKEVGFYYGAMYVSYGVNIAYGVSLFLLTVLILKMELLSYLGLFFGLVVLLFPWTMRISRLIYLNLFVKFDSSKK